MFDRSKCDLCGDCLVQCHYVNYSRDKAIKEIEALIEDRDADILKECITCMGCIEYCESGADPFDLINRQQEKRKSVSVSEQTMNMLGNADKLPSSFKQGDPKRPILSLCAIDQLISPQFKGHKMFDGMSVVTGGDYFCHMGLVHIFRGSTVEAKGRQYIDTLAGLNAEEIIFVHDECYSMVSKKVNDFGIDIPFKYWHIVDYMNKYLKDNSKDIKKLNRRIAYQRPCSARLTPETDDMIDDFFSLIGIERVDRKYDRKGALCCGGIVRGFGQESRGKEIQGMNLKDAMEHGVDAIAYLCPMCGFSLKGICKKNNLRCISLFDFFLMALNEISFP